MTTLLAAPVASLFDVDRRHPTLDEVFVRSWEGLNEHRVVECPVCQGEMEPEYGGHARTLVGGRCVACGSALS